MALTIGWCKELLVDPKNMSIVAEGDCCLYRGGYQQRPIFITLAPTLALVRVVLKKC